MIFNPSNAHISKSNNDRNLINFRARISFNNKAIYIEVLTMKIIISISEVQLTTLDRQILDITNPIHNRT